MIQPIVSANQAVLSRATSKSPYFAGKLNSISASNMSMGNISKGEKLDINCAGCREYSLNGNKVDYFA